MARGGGTQEVLTVLIPHWCQAGVGLWKAMGPHSGGGGVKPEVAAGTATIGLRISRPVWRPGTSDSQTLGHPGTP